MARSYNIYIITNLNNDILAAFTVKYESAGWARSYIEKHNFESIDCLLRYKVRDGLGKNEVEDCPWEKHEYPNIS